MDKYTVDLDKVLNDFEYSELTDQHTSTLQKHNNIQCQNSLPTQITNIFPSSSFVPSKIKNTDTKHSITNVFNSLNEYLKTDLTELKVEDKENLLSDKDSQYINENKSSSKLSYEEKKQFCNVVDGCNVNSYIEKNLNLNLKSQDGLNQKFSEGVKNNFKLQENPNKNVVAVSNDLNEDQSIRKVFNDFKQVDKDNRDVSDEWDSSVTDSSETYDSSESYSSPQTSTESYLVENCRKNVNCVNNYNDIGINNTLVSETEKVFKDVGPSGDDNAFLNLEQIKTLNDSGVNVERKKNIDDLLFLNDEENIPEIEGSTSNANVVLDKFSNEDVNRHKEISNVLKKSVDEILIEGKIENTEEIISEESKEINEKQIAYEFEEIRNEKLEKITNEESSYNKNEELENITNEELKEIQKEELENIEHKLTKEIREENKGKTMEKYMNKTTERIFIDLSDKNENVTLNKPQEPIGFDDIEMNESDLNRYLEDLENEFESQNVKASEIDLNIELSKDNCDKNNIGIKINERNLREETVNKLSLQNESKTLTKNECTPQNTSECTSQDNSECTSQNNSKYISQNSSECTSKNNKECAPQNKKGSTSQNNKFTSQNKEDSQIDSTNISRPNKLELCCDKSDSKREINLVGNPGSTPYNNVYVSKELTVEKSKVPLSDTDSTYSPSPTFSDRTTDSVHSSTSDSESEQEKTCKVLKSKSDNAKKEIQCDNNVKVELYEGHNENINTSCENISHGNVNISTKNENVSCCSTNVSSENMNISHETLNSSCKKFNVLSENVNILQENENASSKSYNKTCNEETMLKNNTVCLSNLENDLNIEFRQNENCAGNLENFGIQSTVIESSESASAAGITNADANVEATDNSGNSGQNVIESENNLVTWLGRQAPLWIPDSEAPSCLHCDTRFTVIKRRHHCRACGLVLCSKCCNLKYKLEYLDAEARVCLKCFNILNRDTNSSSSSEISPTIGNSPNNRPAMQPNPNNPMEYCSVVPPIQQVNALGQNPPTVMVPVGVLKRKGSSKGKSNKSVMFCDGIRPGSDLTNLDNDFNYAESRGATSSKKSSGHVITKVNKNVPCLDPATKSFIPYSDGGLPPTVTFYKSEITYSECANGPSIIEMLKNEPLIFAVQKNLYVHVKIINMSCCINKVSWCFSTEGLITVGQDEVVYLLEFSEDDKVVPKDVFLHINNIYTDAVRGTTLTELGFSLHNAQVFLGSKNHAGFLYIRPTFQCLQNILIPKEPYLIGILMHRWETPWAKIFPLRLLLRLGAEYRYYPSPIVSTRQRDSVFVEIGHTIINLLADFRNFSYTIPNIRGLTIHMEDKNTTVTIPTNRYDQVMKSLSNSSDHILAFGSNFSTQADSHLVCIQDTQGSNENSYTTHAINIQNKPRKVTGASFIVFNGALKSSSGLTAKSSIVEDGLMIQIPPEQMVQIRESLKNMKNFVIQCGCINASSDETVNIVWGDPDVNFNVGVISPIDKQSLSGVPSIRVHNGKDYICNSGNRLIRWTEVFILKNGDENARTPQDPIDISKLSESISKATCQALVKYLDLLASNNFYKIGIRTTLHVENVSYSAGSNFMKLPPIYMKSLDNELIPVLHRITSNNLGENAIILELIFRILNV